MADFTLSDGRELTIDLNRISQREYAAMARGELQDEQYYDLIGRMTGLTATEAGDLPQPEWRRLVAAFYRKAREPLADPN